MKNNYVGMSPVLAVAIGVALICLPALADEEGSTIMIGTIVVSNTDEDGNALAIDLETAEGTYTIELSGVGEDLLWYVGETVEVEGLVTENDDGWRSLEVLSFTVVADVM